MSLLSALASRLLDGVDLGFDALGALWRVTMRGAFTPDAQSYRSRRFEMLADNDLLIQEIALNAEDAGEARKAVALDPEGVLPLAPDDVAFDLAGPLASEAITSRPERRFILGVAKTDRLEALRGALPFGRRGEVEAFVFCPSAAPQSALVFEDQAGRRRRRTRRMAVAIAFGLFAYASNEAVNAGTSAFERASNGVNAQRAALERRIRVAGHEAAVAQATLASLSTQHDPSLADISHELALLARNQAPGAALNGISANGSALVLTGTAYSGESAELALRRAFESARVSFSAQSGAAPAPFEARIDRTIETAP